MNVLVDDEQCQKLAEKLKPLQFRKEIFQRPYLTFAANRETKARAFFYSTTICHQTHTLVNKRKNLKGWDCLEDVYTRMGQENSDLLDPKTLGGFTVEKLSEKLKELFSEDGNPSHCTLDRVQERAGILIQCSQILVQEYEGKVTNLLTRSGGSLINDGQGIYERLAGFPAFADPLRKKSTIFIKFLADAGLFQIKDQEHLVPVMDYHMQRVLLRTGCIKVTDKNLREALLNKTPLPSDENIRMVAVEAIRKIAEYSGKSIFSIHDYFWPLGRSCCRETTLCTDGHCQKRPCTFEVFVEQAKHDHCIFEGACKGQKDEQYRQLWQPMVETEYY